MYVCAAFGGGTAHAYKCAQPLGAAQRIQKDGVFRRHDFVVDSMDEFEDIFYPSPAYFRYDRYTFGLTRHGADE